MEVETRLEAENLLEECEPRLICKSYFTFVLIKGESMVKLPKFVPSTREDEQKFYESFERRQIRFKRRELIRETTSFINSPRLQKDNSFSNSDIGERSVKLISDSSINSSLIVLPTHANPHGNTFGGQVCIYFHFLIFCDIF